MPGLVRHGHLLAIYLGFFHLSCLWINAAKMPMKDSLWKSRRFQRNVLPVRCAIASIFLSLIFVLSAVAETPPHPLPWRPRIADLLKQQVPDAPTPPVESQATISDYEILNDRASFIIAFYVFHPDTDSIHPPLWVLLLDKRNNTWKYREVQSQPGADDAPEWCFGTVLHIKSIAEKFFLETHVTPSASCQFVLSHALNLEHVLFGSAVEVPPSHRLLIEGNAVHFARTHPPRLSLYDPATATETPLFPLADDSSMKWLDHDLSDLIDEPWCRENNSPCEASGLSGAPLSFFVNDKSDALAIEIQYSGEGMGTRAEGFKANVIYVFDLSTKTMQHREYKPDAVHKMFGSYDMEKLTQPSALRQLFSSDSALR